MAPSQLPPSVTSSQDPPRSIITTSTSSSSRANLCSRQHSIVFSVTYGGRTVSICVACALLDFLVKFLFFIPRFILVLASFGVPLLLLPVGSLIDLTSPPMLVAQAIALVWYTCYLPGLQTIQAKRESFNRKRRMLQAVEARRTRSSGCDAGDLRKSRTEMVTSPATKSCGANEMGQTTCGEDEVVTRRSIAQSFGEYLLCLRRLACEKATYASQGVRNGLSSARLAVTRSCWQLMVSARVTVTTTVTTAATTVAATAAATGRAIMTTKALLFTCVRIPAVGARFSVWMLASGWGLLVSRMRIQRHLSSDSASASISDSAFAEGKADASAREAGERTRKRGGKGRKGARLAKGGRGNGGKSEFEAEEHSGCDNNEEMEENETTEQSNAAELESDVAAQPTAEIKEIAEVPELIDGLLEEKETSEKERSRKRAFRKQRRARRERATSDARQGESVSDAEATSVQADMELTRPNMTVKSAVKSEEQQLAQLTQLTQLTKLSPPELSQLIDQLMLVAAGNEGAGSEGDSGESDYISKPAARQSRQFKPSSDTSEANGWESSSSSCSGRGSGSDSSSNAVSRSSSSGGSSSRSNGATSSFASSLSSPHAPPVVFSSFPTPTPSLPPLSPSPSSLSPSLSYTLPSPVSSAGKPLPSPVAPAHVQSFQHQQQQHQQIQEHYHNKQEQHQHQQRASGGAAAAQWEMWGSSRLDTQQLLQQQQQEGNTESAGTRTTSLCWSPDDKPWLPWLPSPTALSPSLKAPGALPNKWSPAPLSPPTEAPGMPFVLPQGSSSSISFSDSAVESGILGFDWLERDADVTLPPPAVPAHVAYAAASATGGSFSRVPQSPVVHKAAFLSSTSHPFHSNNSVKLGAGCVGQQQQQQQHHHHQAVASMLPGSLFEGNFEEPKRSSHGSYSLLGSGFADSLVADDVMYTREAIGEWME